MSKFAYPGMRIRMRIPARETRRMRIHMRMPVQEDPRIRIHMRIPVSRYPRMRTRMRIFVTHLNNTSYCQIGAGLVQNTDYYIIIYHDFLRTPRRGSHVKSDKTHTQSSHTQIKHTHR